jgi:hypothetical protein
MDYSNLHRTTLFRVSQYNAALALFKTLTPVLSACALFVLCFNPSDSILLWALTLCLVLATVRRVYFGAIDRYLVPLLLSAPAEAAFFGAFNNLRPLNMELIKQADSAFWLKVRSHCDTMHGDVRLSLERTLLHVSEQLLVESLLHPVAD